MWLKITNYYSPNFSLPKRNNKKIKYIIIHYTGMKSEIAAMRRLCDVSKNVSAHYFIKNNGEVINLVPDLYEAWHAGKSRWKNLNSLNKNSIGIEISNPGHDFNYKQFSQKQIKSILILSKFLIKKYKISKENILGHSDIAPSRKKDPGERFPWQYLSKQGVGIWHSLSRRFLEKNRMIKIDLLKEKKFFDNIHKIGFTKKKPKNIKKDKFLMLLAQAFQRRFRQELINGKIDNECLLISENLVKKPN